MDDAHYYHSTLYSFDDPRARDAVLESFTQTISNSAVRCWYDTNDHVFQLVCPSFMGSEADEALFRAISNYIDKELDAAEQEEREPIIRRFPESQFDSLDAVDGETDEAHAAPRSSAVDRPRHTHIIITAEGEGKLLKPFHLFQLPDQLLERALAPANDRAAGLFSRAVTCRAVRKQDPQGYVFNGRTGAGQGTQDCDENELRLAPFNVLRDEREHFASTNEIRAKTFEPIGTRTVEQWVLGQGKIKQVDVEERPDMSKDAKKHLAEGITHATGGRPRLPKDYSLIPGDEEKEPETDEVEPSKPRKTFGDLLAARKSDDEDDSSTSTSSESSASIESGEGRPGTFQGLLGGAVAKPERRISGDWNSIKPQQARATPHRPPVVANGAAKRDPPEASSSKLEVNSAEPEVDYNNAFPTYGPAYAKVDTIGLTANPANTAEWLEHHGPLKPQKAKAMPVSSRSQMARSRQASDNSMSGEKVKSPESTRLRATTNLAARAKQGTSASQVARPLPTDEAPNGEWVNKVVPAQISSSHLVDTGVQHSPNPVPVPPGLLPSPKPSQARRRAFQPATSEQTGNLVDCSENVLEAPETAPRYLEPSLDSNTILTPTTPSSLHTPRTSATRDDTDDQIVERVHVFPPGFAAKRNTMRQKAGKKHKHGSKSKATGKAAPVKAVLEKPSPPPPPKKKQPEPAPPLNGLQRERRQAAGQTSSSAAQKDVRPQSVLDPSLAFGQQLLEIIAHMNQENEEDDDNTDEDVSIAGDPQPQLKLVAQFGLLLTRGKTILGGGVYTPEALQVKLNNELPTTQFLSRLTTSTGDVKYLIGIGGKGDESHTEASYEIYIRDSAGVSLKLTLPVSADRKASLTTHNSVVSQAYAHYPTHVWDAHLLLLEPGVERTLSNEKAMEEFLASMQTEGTAPSFKAQIRSATFTVDRVLAKQAVTQDHDGLIYRVVKVQDLFLESIVEPQHNFHAKAAPHDEMIKHHRLWWEAGFETFDLSRAEEVQARLNEIVCSIDGVGLNNRGPFEITQSGGDSDAEDEENGQEGEMVEQQHVGWYW